MTLFQDKIKVRLKWEKQNNEEERLVQIVTNTYS
jgi:hypothetical protein